MSAPPFMQFYPSDYLSDTTHLTTKEHGAYTLLLWAMWRAGGKLPADDGKLAKITLCTPKEWAVMKVTILAFFKRRGGSITHKRIDKEMARYESKIERAKKGANGYHLRKRNKNNEKPLPQAMLKPCQPEPELEPDYKDTPLTGESILIGSASSGRSRPGWALPPDADERAAERAEMAAEAKALIAQLGRKFG